MTPALFPKLISRPMLLFLAINLILGGFVIPFNAARAYPAEIIADPFTIAQTSQESAWYSWDKVQSALQTGYQSTLQSLGISEKVEKKIAEALKWAFTRFKKQLLGMMTDDIVKWIGGGGKPRFVTDWNNFLQTAADRTAGQFVTQYLGAGFLCGPFALKLQIALARPQSFEESVTCTLSQISGTIENFFNDFSQGGWRGWLAVSEPQNNIFGADLLSLDKKYDLEAKAREAAKNEALAGAGYLDDKVCAKRQCGSNPPENFTGGTAEGGWTQDQLAMANGTFCACLSWATRTPGKIAADVLSKTVTQDLDWLLQAKEYSEYIFAVLDAVINRTIKEGVLLLQSSGSGTDASLSASAASVNLSTYSVATEATAASDPLVRQTRLYKENLTSALNEYQQNLNLLNQAKTAQENAVRLLQQMVSAGCSLPAGSSVGTETSTIQSSCGSTTCPCERVTTKTQPFTISGLGSGTLRQIITNRYGQDPDAWFGSTSCTNLTFSSTQSSIINSTLSSISQISATQLEMQALQEKISQVDGVIADATSYSTASKAYTDAYDSALRTSGSLTGATSTEAAMLAARQKALTSLKALTQNNSNNLADQISSIMPLSQEAAQKSNQQQAKRGYSTGCSFVESATYQADLCAAAASESAMQSYLTACTAFNNY